MEVVLFMLLSNRGYRAFPVSKATVTLGRREDCDFRIPLPDVSRRHCRLVVNQANHTVRIEDLGSANGTLVNGKKCQISPVAAGDTISLGPVSFVVQIDGVPADNNIDAAARPPGPKLADAFTVEDAIGQVLAEPENPDPDDSDVVIHLDPPKP